MSPETFAAELPSLILAMAGKGCVIALAGLGVAALLRRASAASRHLVLALTACVLLLLPLVMVALPAWEMAVLPLTPGPSLPLVGAGSGGWGDGKPALGEGDGRTGRVTHPTARPNPPLQEAKATSEGIVALVLILILIPSLLLLRLAAAIWSLRRLAATAVLPPVEWVTLLGEEKRRLGITQPVCLGISARLVVPVTFGAWKPVVLLPEGACNWDASLLREALVHELAHVGRRDWLLQMAARTACALHWFNPLVWRLYRRLLLEAELACDDRVLGAGTMATGYAERLVALARQVRGGGSASSAMAFARPSGLASRVAAILDSRRRRGGPGRLAVVVSTTAALLLLAVVAPARLVRAEPRASGPSRTPPEALGQAVEDGVAGGLADGVTEGIREALEESDSILDGIEEGKREGLVDAAEEGAVEAVRFFLEHGADPNSVVPGDGTPLIAASRGGHAEVVRLLLTAGAHVNQVVPGDESPLIQAAEHGRLEVARLLLEAGADPNIRVLANRSERKPDGDLRTALRMARRSGHEDVEQLLLAHGAKD